jgi:hypothetical protein
MHVCSVLGKPFVSMIGWCRVIFCKLEPSTNLAGWVMPSRFDLLACTINISTHPFEVTLPTSPISQARFPQSSNFNFSYQLVRWRAGLIALMRNIKNHFETLDLEDQSNCLYIDSLSFLNMPGADMTNHTGSHRGQSEPTLEREDLATSEHYLYTK